MKNLVLTMAFGIMLLSAGCKKETTVETTVTSEDGKTVTTTTTTETDYDLRLQKAEADYQAAENDVKAAHEKGDTKAEQIAQDAADKAKEAWEATKAEVRLGAEKTKEALKEVKEGYNETLEKAKTD